MRPCLTPLSLHGVFNNLSGRSLLSVFQEAKIKMCCIVGDAEGDTHSRRDGDKIAALLESQIVHFEGRRRAMCNGK